eukprot:scaffold11236_cov211-Skeletonema_marinoi.AAC.3
MANYHGSLEAVDCHIHSVRYDTDVNRGTRASQMTSSGHLRRCSDADTTKMSMSHDKHAFILSWPTNMGHYKQLIAIFTALETIWC